MQRFLRSALALSTLLVSATAGAQTFTFSQYASPTTREYPAAVGAPLTVGPLDFYDTELFTDGAANALGTWGNDPSDPAYVNRPTNIGGSTTLFAPFLTDEIDVYGAGSDIVLGRYANPFRLVSMDVAHLYSTQYAPFTLGQITLTVSGFGLGTGGATITQTFVIPVPPLVGTFRYPVLQTLVFDNRWTNMYNVWWSQGTGSGTAHQFTNFTIAAAVPVPEPQTYALFAAGLTLLAVVAVRRRRDA